MLKIKKDLNLNTFANFCLQVCSTKASSECLALRWKLTTSRMPLREVQLSAGNKHFKQNVFVQLFHYLFSPSSVFLFSSGHR